MAGSLLHRLIPATRPHVMLPSFAAPKRDHDEWLVLWGLGGAGSPASGPSLRREGLLLVSGAAASLPVLKWSGGPSSRPVGQVRPTGATTSGLDPPPAQAKPKIPIGRRGASLFLSADYRSRRSDLAGPASSAREGSTSHQPEARTPAGFLPRPPPDCGTAGRAESLCPCHLPLP